MNKTIVFLLLTVGGWLIAQTSQGPSNNPPAKENGQVTVQGCLSRSSGDFVLMQTDPGNSYVLRPGRKIKLEHYLGQQVEVTGIESPTISTSSTRNRPTSSVQITVDSISTLSKRCTS